MCRISNARIMWGVTMVLGKYNFHRVKRMLRRLPSMVKRDRNDAYKGVEETIMKGFLESVSMVARERRNLWKKLFVRGTIANNMVKF